MRWSTFSLLTIFVVMALVAFVVAGMTNRGEGWGYAFFLLTFVAVASAVVRTVLYGKDVPFSAGFAVGAILYLAANALDNGLNPIPRMLRDTWNSFGYPVGPGSGRTMSAFSDGRTITFLRQLVDVEYFRFVEMGHCLVAMLIGGLCGLAASLGQRRSIQIRALHESAKAASADEHPSPQESPAKGGS